MISFHLLQRGLSNQVRLVSHVVHLSGKTSVRNTYILVGEQDEQQVTINIALFFDYKIVKI